MNYEDAKTIKQIDESKYRIDIAELKPVENYKLVERPSIDKLKRSLTEDDQLLPILVDARPQHEGEIIGGFHQYFAIKELVDEGKWLHGSKAWIEPRVPKDDKHKKILALKHNTQYDIATKERLAEYAADLIDSEYALSDIPVMTDLQEVTLLDIFDEFGLGKEIDTREPIKLKCPNCGYEGDKSDFRKEDNSNNRSSKRTGN